MAQPPMFDMTSGLSAIKDASAAWFRFMGIDQPGNGVPNSLKDFGKQPADEAWVYACMNVRAMNAAGVPLRVQVKDSSRWVDVDDINDSAATDLQFLLDDVNPAWEGTQLQAYSEAGAVVHGGSAWRKVRGRLGGPPQELYWLSAADIKPVTPYGAFPLEYDHQPNGVVGERIAAKDLIVHRDTVNLQDPYTFLSPLSAARNAIAAAKALGEQNAAIINNWAIPPGAWVAAKDSNIGPGEQNAIRRALRAVRGPKNQGKVPVLPGGLTWVPLSLTQKDADWLGTGKVSRMMVSAATGVPLVIAGDDEKTSVYAAARDAERGMWRITIIPVLDRRASRIDSWLVPDFDKTRKHLRVRFDYTGIEALRAMPAEDMAQWNEAVKIGLPLNRYIARFGMGAPVEGGDEARILLRTGEIPVADATNVQTLQTTSPLSGQGSPTPAPSSTPRPETNNTGKTVLPEKLYRDASVKAYIESGDPAVLAALVPEHLIPALAEGIRQRESAEQITARFEEQP